MSEVVDVHHHYVPESIARRNGYVPGETISIKRDGVRFTTLHDLVVDLDLQVADMDKGGIDLAVQSVLLGWDEDLDVCREVNDDAAQVAQRYPGRVVGYAHLPLKDMDAALAELQRAKEELGLPGVAVMTRIDDRFLDDESLYPFYQRAEELEMPIFVHPALACDGHPGAEDHDLDRIIGREFDLMTAVSRLIAGEVLERFPGLAFIMSHFGGGIAGVKDRLRGKAYRFDNTLKRSFDEYFDMIYFDLAGAEGQPGALACGLTAVSTDRLMFATDYPQDFTGATTDSGVGPEGMAAYVDRVRNLDLPDNEINNILGGNAHRLMQLPRR